MSVLQKSIIGSILIIMMLLFRKRNLHKISPKIFQVMWQLIGIRLLFDIPLIKINNPARTIFPIYSYSMHEIAYTQNISGVNISLYSILNNLLPAGTIIFLLYFVFLWFYSRYRIKKHSYIM